MIKYNEVREIKDLKDMLNQSKNLYGTRPAFKIKKDGQITEITHNEFAEQVDSLGTRLIDLGFKDKRIAIIGENRYEWSLAYLSIACGTGVVVPLDKLLPAAEIESLIIRSEAECIVYSNKYKDIMDEIKKHGTTKLKAYISMDEEKSEKEVYSQKQLVEEGRKLVSSGNTSFMNAEIDRDKMTFMLFTSGTTQVSKAVMLSHKNIASNLVNIDGNFKMHETDCFLSFLPLHHTFECTAGFLLPIYKGCSIAYCEGIKHIADNLKEYQTTVFLAVPALYEGMYKKLLKGIEAKGKTETVKKGVKISNFLLKFGIDIRKKLFKDIHANLGGNIRLFISGAAPFDPETEKAFRALGFNCAQGYGLTETSPVIAVTGDNFSKCGTVGKPIKNMETKIDNPNEQGIGEIITKGESVMLGYYQNTEATEEVIKDGWFYTGDLGCFDKDGFLTITGRKKNVIVLNNGKNVYPEELETLLNKSDIIKESFVYGKDEKDEVKICAKIVYDIEAIKEKHTETESKELHNLIWQEIKEINKQMPTYKYVKEITITEEELIKTTTQKIKRYEEMQKIKN